MNHNCETFREALLIAERPLKSLDTTRSTGCPACDAWLRDTIRIMDAYQPSAAPAPELDRRVMAAAHAELSRIRRRRCFLRRCVPFASATAAAAAICVFWLQPAAPVGGTVTAMADIPDTIPWEMYEKASFELDQELTGRQLDFGETAVLW